MAGDHELQRLAQLLKLCSELASTIAATRDDDSARIYALSYQTSEIARQLDELVSQSRTLPEKAADALHHRH